jgi:hypothetical protein
MYGNSERTTTTSGRTSRLTFTGTRITVVYTRGQGRAIANVTIDGVAQAPIDQYRSSTAYRQTTTYTVAAGSHTIVVTHSGTRNPAANGSTVGVDAFVVNGTTP